MITSTSNAKVKRLVNLRKKRKARDISYRRTSDVRGSAGGQTSGNLCDRTFL